MTKASENQLTATTQERIASRIMLIRGQKVMLDADLATLYGVETRELNQAVRRNIERFPEDFMFQLTQEEFATLRSQIVTLKGRGRHPKYLSLVFTEQGVAMLSSVLRSKRAIYVNIAIMRTFVRLRQLLTTDEQLRKKIESMEKKYDKRFRVILDVIKELIAKEDEPEPERRIGFRMDK
jgi:hypothetical protein